MHQHTKAALDRLFTIAKGDSGQCARVANFLLAWWNGPELGGFDLAEIFAVDMAIGTDMATIVAYLAQQTSPVYPEDRQADIDQILEQWRPAVWARAQGDAA